MLKNQNKDQRRWGKMEYVYGALLLHAAGKEINEENLKNVIKAAGIEVDEARVKALVNSLKDINIDEAVKSSAVMTTAVTAPSAPETKEEAKEEKKKEEKKEEEKAEEEAVAGLASLFG